MSISPPAQEAGFQPLLKQALTSVQTRTNVDFWEMSQQQLALPTDWPWSIKKYKLYGGKQEGVDVIEVNNGCLRFTVIPTRGMSMLRVDSGDVRLGWNSPVKEIVHPQFMNLNSRGGLGWLEGFNEWMVRCGLEWAGHPGQDKFRNNVGDEVEMELTLHGKVGNIPASEVDVLIEPGSPPRIHIRGLVEERMFYGPKLSLWTDISTELGSRSFRLQDSLTNQGSHRQEYQIIYHANFGPPLLGPGSRFAGAISRVTPFNSHAAKDVKSFSEYTGPQPGFIEQVYCLEPAAGADGCSEMMLQNPSGDRGVSLVFPVPQLPCVTLWKNLATEAEGYVTGIEPGTSFPRTRRLEREAGRVPKLRPDDTRRFVIDFTIHSDAQAVQAAANRIHKIQGERETAVDASPIN